MPAKPVFTEEERKEIINERLSGLSYAKIAGILSNINVK